MARVADYVIVDSTRRTLDNDDRSHTSDVELAANVHLGSRSVLMFRVNPSSDFDGTLVVSFVRLVDDGRRGPPTPPRREPSYTTSFRFDTGVSRSFHFVVPASALASRNELSFTAQPRAGSATVEERIRGSLAIDDVVLLVQAET